MRVFFSTLGCKLNQAETEAWRRQVEARGHRVAASLAEADLHVVNSCAVTAEAVRDSRRAARRSATAEVRTVWTGCAAELPAEPPAAERVIAHRDKDRLVELLLAERAAGEPGRRPAGGRARVPLKIEDGCTVGCAFCVIPSTRGPRRSRPADDVVRDLERLEAEGCAEAVLTGVQISAYRDGSTRLADLVARLLDATGRVRLRLTSIAPWRLDPRLLELLTHPRVCRHVHLSLQSGARETLRRMRRPGTPEGFARLVESVRAAAPGVAITSDVIAGFPGESAAEHEESLAFVEAMRFARLHVFGYSERPGTAAASLPDPVAPTLRKARVARMRAAAARAARAFLEERIGAVEEVVWEGRREGRWLGTTGSSLRASLAAPATGRPRRGALAAVRLLAARADGTVDVEPAPGATRR